MGNPKAGQNSYDDDVEDWGFVFCVLKFVNCLVM